MRNHRKQNVTHIIVSSTIALGIGSFACPKLDLVRKNAQGDGSSCPKLRLGEYWKVIRAPALQMGTETDCQLNVNLNTMIAHDSGLQADEGGDTFSTGRERFSHNDLKKK